MVDTVRGLHALQWTNAVTMVVLDINDNQANNKWQTKDIDPPGGGKLQVLTSGSFLAYRLLDLNDVEIERGSYAAWSVVSVELVIP